LHDYPFRRSFDTLSAGTFFTKNETRQKNGAETGILALKTQKRTPKSQTNQRSGLSLVHKIAVIKVDVTRSNHLYNQVVCYLRWIDYFA